MGRAIGLAATAVLLLGACYPYRLSGEDVIPTDQRFFASGGRYSPGEDFAAIARSIGLTVTEESLDAGFGSVALTRFEHAQPRPLIVFCGGNMFRRKLSGQGVVRTLAPLGDVWVFDYPGYGDSAGAGQPEQFEAMNAALARRVEAVLPERRDPRLTFWGHSLGGLVCGDLAGRTQAESDVVLVASFQSFPEVVRAGAAARVGPLGVLVRPEIADDVPRFDVAQALEGRNGGVVVVGARDDAVVSYRASVRLEQALRRQGLRTRLITVPSADHSRIHGAPGLIEQIEAALSDLRASGGTP